MCSPTSFLNPFSVAPSCVGILVTKREKRGILICLSRPTKEALFVLFKAQRLMDTVGGLLAG